MRRDRVWGWALGAWLLVQVPWVLGWLLTPGGHLYTGLLGGGDDYLSYLAKIRQGWEGRWRWENRFDPAGHGQWFLYPFYLATGHILRWLGGGVPHIPLAFHLTGAATGFAVVLLLACMVRAAVPREAQAHALLLAVFGSAGTVWVRAGALGGLGYWIQGLDGYPAPHLYLGMLFYPHYLVDVAGLLVLALAMSGQIRPPWDIVASALAGAAVSMVHPHVAFLGGLAAAIPVLGRRISLRRGLVAVAAWGLGSAPYSLYVARILADPELAAWRAQSVARPVPLWLGLFWWGAAGPLALAELRRAWQEGGVPAVLSAWLVTALVGANAGRLLFSASAELLMGASVPAGILAARTLWRMRPGPLRDVLAGLGLAGAAILLVGLTLAVVDRSPTDFQRRLYLPLPEVRRLAEEVGDGAVVASTPGLMSHVPWLFGKRVLWGHTAETPRQRERLALVRELCSVGYGGEKRPTPGGLTGHLVVVPATPDVWVPVHQDWERDRFACTAPKGD